MKKVFSADTMKRICYLSWPVISENGKWFAFVKSRGEEESGLFPSRIFLIDARTGEERPLNESDDARGAVTADGAADVDGASNAADAVFEKQPMFLGDDRVIFLSKASGEYQLYEKRIGGGPARQITTLRHGVTRWSLSKDQKKIAFEAVLWPEELEQGSAFTEMSQEEKRAWEEELDSRPYEITNLVYKLDDWYGMRHGEYAHIGTVGTDGSGAEIIDTHGMEAVYPAWSDDGSMLAFHGYPYDGAKGRQPEVFCCREDGSEMTQLTDSIGIYADHFPAFTDGDTAVIACGFPPFDDGSTVLLPYKVNIASKEAKLIIGEWDEAICHGLNPLVSSRSEYGDRRTYFRLSEDGRMLYFLSCHQGKGSLYQVPTSADGKVEYLLEVDGAIEDFAIGSGSILYTMGDWTKPAELYISTLRTANGADDASGDNVTRAAQTGSVQQPRTGASEGGKPPSEGRALPDETQQQGVSVTEAGKQLTVSNAWLDEYALGRVREFHTASGDGKVDLLWYLVYPAGYEEGKSYPAVLDIKGGPETVFARSFWHEFQALAGRNMAVIYGNPRGSVGFGRDFCAHAMCWGKEAMEDLLTIVDAAVQTGVVDPERVGVTGGSYGGYMTNKLIGRTDVFAAAVTQRSLANPATSYGTGDMGFVSSTEVPEGFRMLDYLEDRARGNIISYIDSMKTPLLILHAYRDYRCSFEQGEQLFTAMKERNPEVPLRFVMFPEENHALTRTGKLYNQIRHLSEMVEWFSKYLSADGQRSEDKDNGTGNNRGGDEDE